MALLLTGAPGVGKTTLVQRVAAALAGERLGGFTTDEIRQAGKRCGFRLDTFDGRSAVLAHVGLRSPRRVGRYAVDLAALEGLLEALAPEPAVHAYLVDEIGRMECLSARFVAAIRALFDSRRPLVATIAARGTGFIEEAKRRRDVEVWTVTRENRDALPARVVDRLRPGRR